GLLNCHRPVYPLRFGGPDGWDDWTLAAWCDQCHRKNGLVVWTRAGHETKDFRYGEPLADLVLGKIDAFEIDCSGHSPCAVLPGWYDLLAAGFRIPLVGASGKDGNGIALGTLRTYARLQPEEALTYANWIEAVRAGRTFVTNGPLLSFQVAGQDPGALVGLPGPATGVRVRAEAHGMLPFDGLELIANGTVLAAAEPSGTPPRAVLGVEVPLPESSGLAGRGRSGSQRLSPHTSPVYVHVEAGPPRTDPAVRERLAGELDKVLAWVQHSARCPGERQR